MYYDTIVNRLDTYDIGVGDKVYILTSPNNTKLEYTFREGTIIRIAKNTSVHERPNEATTKHYKAKLRMWLEYINRDECDKCSFTVHVSGDNYSREIARKYLYTLEEKDILDRDIKYLNLIYLFKKKQQEEFDQYIKSDIFEGWNYYCFENIRKKGVENMPLKERLCPRCGNTYLDYPAISRKDNKTEICTTCGQAEALIQYSGGDLANDKWKLENKE